MRALPVPHNHVCGQQAIGTHMDILKPAVPGTWNRLRSNVGILFFFQYILKTGSEAQFQFSDPDFFKNLTSFQSFKNS